LELEKEVVDGFLFCLDIFRKGNGGFEEELELKNNKEELKVKFFLLTKSLFHRVFR